MKIKNDVLVIGQSGLPGVYSIAWDGKEPNLTDYDVVILDLTTLEKSLPPIEALSVQYRSRLDMSQYLEWHRFPSSVIKLLFSRGKLIIIAKQDIIAHPDTSRGTLEHIQRASLLPFIVHGEVVAKGQSITWVDPRFTNYFEKLGGWNFTLTGTISEHFKQYTEEQVNYRVNPIARNRANELLAIEILFTKKGARLSGSAYILPPPTQITTREAIDSLLYKLGDIIEPIPSEPPNELSKEKKRNMPGIPSTILTELRQTLMECDEFANQRQLRAIFSEQRLHTFQSGLPEGSSVGERVDMTVSYLMTKNLTSGENGLIVFLHVLSDRRDPADELHNRLVRLADEMEITINGKPSKQPSHEVQHEEIVSLKRQLAQLKRNMFKLQEKKASFVDPRNIPIDLIESERLVLQEIQHVNSRLAELGEL